MIELFNIQKFFSYERRIQMLKAIFFDLDGTLLPMDYDDFCKMYFSMLTDKLSERGYPPKEITEAVWSGTKAMLQNDGSKTNEKVFWIDFEKHFGKLSLSDRSAFDEFYRNDFNKISAICSLNPSAKDIIKTVKSLGFISVLATNPVFPSIATENRIRWAGLLPSDFVYYTTYENSSFCKPKPEYYYEILDKLSLSPNECAMIGNDVDDDMPAAAIGMKVFLLTDCLINRSEKNISIYPHGDWKQLKNFIFSLKSESYN